MKPSLFVVAALSILLAACSSTPVATTEAPVATAATPAPVSPPPAEPTATAPVAQQPVLDHTDMNSPLYKQRSVYFDYDVYTIKSEFTAMLELHAGYLKSHPELQVKLEGNADERGGREYNLSLGQKRSEAVKRALVTLGAGEAQLEAVSYGKEKPRATGHDEVSWAENRRVDFVYAPKK
jgi:peptidoglycan-associated lipoprotein